MTLKSCSIASARAAEVLNSRLSATQNKAPARRKKSVDERDAVVESLLQFMEKQMIDHPQDIVPADLGQLRRIGKLVKGVTVD